MNAADAKKSLRQAMQTRLESQSVEERKRRSALIQKKLWGLPAFQKAKLVFFFASMAEEVDTHGMIDAALSMGKRVAVPLADLKTKKLSFYEIHDRSTELKPGVYGIPEPDKASAKPILPGKADCVLVPGVVFDRQKHRIGHGAGFYDRFLGDKDLKAVKVALAYSFQVIDRVPQEKHDVTLDELIAD